jgi:hypothetical protein
MGRTCSTNGGGKRNTYGMLLGNPGGKRPLERPRRRWVDNIKMDHRFDGAVWTGSIWLRIEISGGFLRTR